MKVLLILTAAAALSALPARAQEAGAFAPVACEGSYPRHLQGVCSNGRDALYWSWTDYLVKTDPRGRILRKVPVANHHGDLCHHDGRIYVATNLGKFNRPAGEADSWVFVYDAGTLAEVARHALPELVHGAGGMEYHEGRFIVVGGLPAGVEENYAYEYDEKFVFRKRHVIASGYTLMGIQTVAHADGAWWFGCYGNPAELVRADDNFGFTGRWPFNAAVGLVPLGGDRFLVARNTAEKDAAGKTTTNRANLIAVRRDEKAGMVAGEP